MTNNFSHHSISADLLLLLQSALQPLVGFSLLISTDHSTPLDEKVKKIWYYICLLPLYAFMA